MKDYYQLDRNDPKNYPFWSMSTKHFHIDLKTNKSPKCGEQILIFIDDEFKLYSIRNIIMVNMPLELYPDGSCVQYYYVVDLV